MFNEWKKVYNIIGIAIRARKVIYGASLISSIKKQKVFLVLSSETIGKTQRKMFSQKCFFYNIKYQSEIPADLFKTLFSTANVQTIGIIDQNFAKKICEEINQVISKVGA